MQCNIIAWCLKCKRKIGVRIQRVVRESREKNEITIKIVHQIRQHRSFGGIRKLAACKRLAIGSFVAIDMSGNARQHKQNNTHCDLIYCVSFFFCLSSSLSVFVCFHFSVSSLSFCYFVQMLHQTKSHSFWSFAFEIYQCLLSVSCLRLLDKT